MSFRRMVRWMPAFLVLASGAGAQNPAATITGTVRDETGRELEHALIALDPSTANVRTRADVLGRFRFTEVASGEHVLHVTWIGFEPLDRRVSVNGKDVNVEIVLRRTVTALDTVVVRGRRTGVYGMIIDGLHFQPLPGARVEVLGGRSRPDTTAQDGLYALPDVKRGSYLLRASRSGYATRVMSVDIARSGETRLDVVLDSTARNDDLRMEMLWADLDSRMHARGFNAALITRDELAARGDFNADVAIKFAPTFAKGTYYVPTTACLFVDGMPAPSRILADFTANEIEAVEIYGRRGEMTGTLAQRWPPHAPCGRPSVYGPPRTANVIQWVVVWLKK